MKSFFSLLFVCFFFAQVGLAEGTKCTEDVKRSIVVEQVGTEKLVHFTFSSSFLDSETKCGLNDVVKIISADPKSRIEVIGESSSNNPILSMKDAMQKAQLALQYLADQGVELERVSFKTNK